MNEENIQLMRTVLGRPGRGTLAFMAFEALGVFGSFNVYAMRDAFVVTCFTTATLASKH